MEDNQFIELNNNVEKKSNKKLIIIIASIIFVLLVGIVLYLFVFKDNDNNPIGRNDKTKIAGTYKFTGKEEGLDYSQYLILNEDNTFWLYVSFDEICSALGTYEIEDNNIIMHEKMTFADNDCMPNKYYHTYNYIINNGNIKSDNQGVGFVATYDVDLVKTKEQIPNDFESYIILYSSGACGLIDTTIKEKELNESIVFNKYYNDYTTESYVYLDDNHEYEYSKVGSDKKETGKYKFDGNKVMLDNDVEFLFINKSLYTIPKDGDLAYIYQPIDYIENLNDIISTNAKNYIMNLSNEDSSMFAKPNKVEAHYPISFYKKYDENTGSYGEEYYCSITYDIYFDNYVKSYCDVDKTYSNYAIGKGKCNDEYITNKKVFSIDESSLNILTAINE